MYNEAPGALERAQREALISSQSAAAKYTIGGDNCFGGIVLNAAYTDGEEDGENIYIFTSE